MEGSVAENGYITFDNGLIIQWGVVKAAAWTQWHFVSFPLRFPNKVFSGQFTHGTDVYLNYQSAGAFIIIDNGSFKIMNTGLSPVDLYWMAFGN